MKRDIHHAIELERLKNNLRSLLQQHRMNAELREAEKSVRQWVLESLAEVDKAFKVIKHQVETVSIRNDGQ